MSSRTAVSPDQFTSFGELLKYLRRRCTLSQRELSIAVGYSESQISRLEQNQRAPDAAAVAARFVPALHLDGDQCRPGGQQPKRRRHPERGQEDHAYGHGQ